MDSCLKSTSAIAPSLPPLAAAKAGKNYHGQVTYRTCLPPPPTGTVERYSTISIMYDLVPVSDLVPM